MGLITFNGFEVEFDSCNYNQNAKDSTVEIVLGDWYEDSQLVLRMEEEDEYNCLFLLNEYGGTNFGHKRVCTSERFDLASLKEEIFNSWVKDNMDNIVVTLGDEKEEKETPTKKKRKI